MRFSAQVKTVVVLGPSVPQAMAALATGLRPDSCEIGNVHKMPGCRSFGNSASPGSIVSMHCLAANSLSPTARAELYVSVLSN